MQEELRNTRKLRVKTITQQIFEFEVPLDMLISQFKEELLRKTEVPIDRQRLIFMGKMVQDNQTIGEILKEDNQTIHLMAMTLPQQPQQQQQQQQQAPRQQQQIPQQFGNGVFQMQFSNLPGQQGQQPPPEQMSNITNRIQDLIGSLFGGNVAMVPPQDGQPLPQQPSQGYDATQQQQPQQQAPRIHVHHNHHPNQTQQANQAQHQHPNQFTNQHPHQHQHTHHHPHSQPVNGRPQQQGLQLPFPVLHHLSRQIDMAFGPQCIFPGPQLPQAQQPRNGAVILGSYLHSLCFSLQRALPILQRTADLLQREAYMNNVDDRRSTERMCGISENILEDLNQAVQITPLLHNLLMGNEPGQGRIVHPSRSAQQQYQQQAPIVEEVQQEGVVTDIYNIQIQLDEQHQQPIQGMSEIVVGIQSLDGLAANLNSIFQPQGQTGGQQQQQPSQIFEVQLPSGDWNQIFNQQGVQGQNPITQEQQIQLQQLQQQQQQQQQQQLQQQQQQQVPQQALNPMAMLGPLLSGLGGGQQGGGPNLFGMSIRELMMQNYQTTMDEGEMELLEVFADVKVGDIMGAQMSGNWAFLDNLHGSIREKMRNQIEKAGSRQNLAAKLGLSIVQFICPEEQDKHLIMEGFEPETVATEVVNRNILKLMDVVDRDYSGQLTKFSTELLIALKLMIGECVHEISEGLYQGLTDYKLIFQHNSASLLIKTVGQEMAQLAQMMLSDMLWAQFIQAHDQYTRSVEVEQQRRQAQQENSQILTEEQLLNLIEQAPSTLNSSYQSTQLTQEYFKGSPSYKKYLNHIISSF